MLVFLTKAVVVLSEIIRVAKEIVRFVSEFKEAKSKVAAILAKKKAEEVEENKSKPSKNHWNILNYPAMTEEDYPSHGLFGMPEADCIM
jgi:hypothetical protein